MKYLLANNLAHFVFIYFFWFYSISFSGSHAQIIVGQLRKLLRTFGREFDYAMVDNEILFLHELAPVPG